MPGRKYSAGSIYRYGFNGKENDNDVKGIEGGQQDYGMRIYDPRVGKFLSVDPITSSYPMLTPYQYASNSGIANVDLDGNEKLYYTLTMEAGKPKLTQTNRIDTYKASDGKTAKFPLSYFITFGKDEYTFTESSLTGGKYGNAPDNTVEKFNAWFYAVSKGETVPGFTDLFYSDRESGVMLLEEAVLEWGLGLAVPKDKGTIYEVPGEATSSGKPYIGRHNKPNPSVTRKSNDGRDRTKLIVKDTYDENDPKEGQYKEQKMITKKGGVAVLDNKRNEVNPVRMIELEKIYGQGKWKTVVPKSKTEKAQAKEDERQERLKKAEDMIRDHF